MIGPEISQQLQDTCDRVETETITNDTMATGLTDDSPTSIDSGEDVDDASTIHLHGGFYRARDEK